MRVTIVTNDEDAVVEVYSLSKEEARQRMIKDEVEASMLEEDECMEFIDESYTFIEKEVTE